MLKNELQSLSGIPILNINYYTSMSAKSFVVWPNFIEKYFNFDSSIKNKAVENIYNNKQTSYTKDKCNFPEEYFVFFDMINSYFFLYYSIEENAQIKKYLGESKIKEEQEITDFDIAMMFNEREAVVHNIENISCLDKDQLNNFFNYCIFNDDLELLKKSIKNINNFDLFDVRGRALDLKSFLKPMINSKKSFYPKKIMTFLTEQLFVQEYEKYNNNLQTIRDLKSKNRLNKKDNTEWSQVCHIVSLCDSVYLNNDDYENYYKAHKWLSLDCDFYINKNRISNSTKYNTTKILEKIIVWQKSIHSNINFSSIIFKDCWNPYTTPAMKKIMNKLELKKDLCDYFEKNKIDIEIDQTKLDFLLKMDGTVDSDKLVDNIISKSNRMKSDKKAKLLYDLILYIEQNLPEVFYLLWEKGSVDINFREKEQKGLIQPVYADKLKSRYDFNLIQKNVTMRQRKRAVIL